MNTLQFICINFILFTCIVIAEIHVNSIDLRAPKWNDIGLVFDVSIVNTVDTEKEILEVRIRGEKCCLNISHNDQLCNINRIVGGFFGPLEPGEAMTLSVILPTRTVYNRVGNCAIGIMSLNASEYKKKIVHQFPFNTTIKKGNIPQIMRRYVGTRNISDCATRDLDPFNKCKPVNCEEKYFGQRGYFDNSTNICLKVPNCSGKGVLYDIFQNECIDPSSFFNKKDIEMLQRGECDNNTLDLKRSVEPQSAEKNATANHVNDVSTNVDRSYRRVTWEEFSHAILVIFATIGIYLTICFIIFLTIAYLSKKNSMKLSSDISFDRTPRSGMSVEVTQRDVSDKVCIPYPEKDE